jgi:hypothetical protein
MNSVTVRTTPNRTVSALAESGAEPIAFTMAYTVRNEYTVTTMRTGKMAKNVTRIPAIPSEIPVYSLNGLLLIAPPG